MPFLATHKNTNRPVTVFGTTFRVLDGYSSAPYFIVAVPASSIGTLKFEQIAMEEFEPCSQGLPSENINVLYDYPQKKGQTMKDLIEAFQIFSKYAKGHAREYPTSCEHDVMYVHVEASKVSDEDKARLEKLGFDVSEDLGNFYSYKFGSA